MRIKMKRTVIPHSQSSTPSSSSIGVSTIDASMLFCLDLFLVMTDALIGLGSTTGTWVSISEGEKISLGDYVASSSIILTKHFLIILTLTTFGGFHQELLQCLCVYGLLLRIKARNRRNRRRCNVRRRKGFRYVYFLSPDFRCQQRGGGRGGRRCRCLSVG